MNASPMELAEKIHAGTTPDIKPAVKRKLESLVKVIVKLRKMAHEVNILVVQVNKMLTSRLVVSGCPCMRFNSTVAVAHRL